MKQYYQGEDIPFSVPFSSEFRNAESFFEFSEIRSYAYTDGCLIQKFSTVNKSGYGKLTTINGELSGIIRSEYSSRFSPGAIIIEIIGMKQSSELQYDIGKTVIGGLKKSLIKNEKLDGNIFLSLDKNSINFDANTSETVTVTITGTDNKSFTVSNTPSWLTVTKTNAGFTLTAAPNPKEYPRDVKLTVSSDAYPSASASLSVTQEGAWLSEFVFDVKTTAINQDIPRLFCMAAEESGEAQINWGEKDANGKDITETVTVNPPTDVQLTDQQGNHFTVKVGEDFTHTYATAGQREVTVKVRKGVNVFRFSSIKKGATEDWGATYLPNPYITTIRKILSPSLTSGYKMFAGVVNGSFASDWDGLETPNMTDFDFMFENFGNKDTGSGYDYTVNDNMRFPSNMYQNITHKDQVHKLNRTYYGSGFEKIEKSMLSCAADGALTSVFETFRQMRNVGANWGLKYGIPQMVSGTEVEAEEFVKTDLFWNQPNISNFTGCFNAINDNYTNNAAGRIYSWRIKKDLFKNNVAVNLNLSWMFNKATRSVLETEFLSDIAQRIERMDGCFWNFGHGSQRVSYGDIIRPYNGTDLNTMFPDASYPNMKSMVGAFGYYGEHGEKRDIMSGFQNLIMADRSDGPQRFGNDPQWGGANWGDGGYLWKSPISIAGFLGKFEHVTAVSGTDPTDNTTVIDGAAYNFGDFDASDGDIYANPNGAVKKASDYDTYNARPQVKQRKALN